MLWGLYMRCPLPIGSVHPREKIVSITHLIGMFEYARSHLKEWQAMADHNVPLNNSTEKISQDIKDIICKTVKMISNSRGESRKSIVQYVDFPFLNTLGKLLIFFAQHSQEDKKSQHIVQTIWSFFHMTLMGVLPFPKQPDQQDYQFLFLLNDVFLLLDNTSMHRNQEISNIVFALGMMMNGPYLQLPQTLQLMSELFNRLIPQQSMYQDMVNLVGGFGQIIKAYHSSSMPTDFDIDACFKKILSSCALNLKSIFNKKLLAWNEDSVSEFYEKLKVVRVETEYCDKDFKQIFSAIDAIKAAQRSPQVVAGMFSHKPYTEILPVRKSGEPLRSPSPL